MLTLQISEADLAQVKILRTSHSIWLIRLRFEVLYQVYLGLSRGAVADLCGVHRNTVKNYIKIYNTEGLSGLMKFNYRVWKGCMEKHRATLFEYFKSHPPSTAKEAAARILEMTGTELSVRETTRFLHSMGFKAIKSGHIPGKADPEKQEAFLNDTLQPLIDQAVSGVCHLFFMDAAHFVLQPYLGILWCLTRVFVKAGSGRNRMNVLGALHFVTKKMETIVNTDYIDASTIVEMLEQIAAKYKDKPIAVVLDNARYQHCEFVKERAIALGIALVFLPPYSPNLNLIERVWKYIKKNYLQNKYFENALLFHTAIRGALSDLNMNPSVKAELKTLVTPRFQTFAQNLLA